MTLARSRTATGAVVAAVVVTLSALTLLPGAAPLAAGSELVPFTGCQELLGHYRDQLAKNASPWGNGGGYAMPAMEDSARSSADSSTAMGVAATGSGATGTNLQEAGVDEPDTAKAVDGLLYAVAQGRLQVVRTGPQPSLLSSLPLGENVYGGELLVQGDRALLLLSGGGGYGDDSDASRSFNPVSSSTRLVLVDVADPSAPSVLEELELDGRYLSARLSEGAVRLVTSSYPTPETAQMEEPYGPAQEQRALEANRRFARQATLDVVLPQAVRRDAQGNVVEQGPAVDCADVRHAVAPQGASTLLVTTLDLTRGLDARDSTAVTTDGDLVYASADRLYVATSRWGTVAPLAGDAALSSISAPTEVTTELHAFDTTSPSSTSYLGSGSVDGYVLGRWALSSFEGHLRVATTSAAPWGDGPPSSSSVTVLAEGTEGLTETGSVGGLGVGEQIYAVRYFGDLATVVTFRQTDPLYVLDLADPAAPRVLGELKIPGFSTYLHPVGDDRLLGVGMDADADGRTTGFQVSLFDVSDRSAPVQLDRLSLGEGYSQAGDDSRAFGYDVKRSTALLPFTTWTPTSSASSALGVRVGDDGTLSLAGQLPVGPATTVERVLHDEAGVYAVTAEGVTAGSPDALTATGQVRFDR